MIDGAAVAEDALGVATLLDGKSVMHRLFVLTALLSAILDSVDEAEMRGCIAGCVTRSIATGLRNRALLDHPAGRA